MFVLPNKQPPLGKQSREIEVGRTLVSDLCVCGLSLPYNSQANRMTHEF